MRFGCDGPGFVLLLDVKEATRLDRSVDMSVHVSTCTSYDLIALTSVFGSCGADKTCVFLHLVTQMSDRVLEQRISVKFCVKLWKNATYTCVMLSKAYGGEAMEESSFSEWYKRFKESSHVEITNADNAQHFFDIKGTVRFESIPQGQTVNQAHYIEILKRLREAVHTKSPELRPND
jgi:hypothetical protein